MKPKERFFFYKDGHFENCYELDHFLQESKVHKDPIAIVGAKMMYGEDFFFCSDAGTVFLKMEDSCGIICKSYSPRNGSTGRCRFSRNCYEPNGNTYLVRNGKIAAYTYPLT